MTRLFLWVTVGVFLSVLFPTALISVSPGGTVATVEVSEPPTSQDPSLTENQTRALEGLAEGPSLAPWQREFVRELADHGPSTPTVTGGFWGSEATETDGVWSQILPPSGRADHTAIYDPVRNRMVVFGGYQFSAPSLRNDVWALSLGATPTWTELTPSGTPPTGRRNHTAIYDPVRDRMVVFGGVGSAYRNDVWALSLGGTPTWTLLTPSGTPPVARRSHTAIYDPIRDRMVVFGGYESSAPNYRNDVWALSLGASPAWTEITPTATPPSVRADHTTIYDPLRDRMVVFGGSDGTYRNDVWALSLGASPAWTELTPTGTPPSVRAEHTTIYDPVQDRMVVYGEWDGSNALKNDQWALSLGETPAWTDITPLGIAPAGRWAHTAIYDPVQERMVVFGGYPNYANDAWAFSLGETPAWTELPPLGTAPAGRSFHAAIYDPVRDRMVMPGGYPMYGHDVWSLSLGGEPEWTRLNPTGTPPVGRKNHAGIYDPIRDRLVIYAGIGNYPEEFGINLYLADVWALSLGASPAWTELVPTGPLPHKRATATAIYDPVRDRMIVFGGEDGSNCFNDVWALSLGENPAWTKLVPTGPLPIPRRRHAAAYDPVRDRLVVFGGYDSLTNYNCLNDTWALSLGGSPAWTELTPSGTPPIGRGRHTAIYDPIRDRMVVFGGWDCDYHYLNDAWALSLGASPAWTPLAPGGTLPSTRSGQTAIYDPMRDRMVVFGGAASYHLNDVWGLVWGTSSCAIPEILSYEPSMVTSGNCAAGCTVSFVVDTQDDYTAVSKITLERYLEGMWVVEDSVLAPLPAPTWTLTEDIDEHYTDGEHIFHAVFHCGDGSKSVSETATVVADRGVPVAIRGFEPVYSSEYSRQGVVLRWSVLDGVELQGFNIYKSLREREGFERINEALIPVDGGNEYTDRDVRAGETYWYRLGAVDVDGEWTSQTVTITVPGASLALHQNVPNPFNPTTTISFVLPERAKVTLTIYDVEGRCVRTLVDEVVEGGVRKAEWDGTDTRGNRVGSGMYFYRLTTGDKSLTKKMLLLK